MTPDASAKASAPEDDLETAVHRELRKLPAPRAPHSLLPRVMAAAQEWSRRPWYGRAWLTWPAAWQAVSIAALVLVITGGLMLAPRVEAAGAAALSTVQARVIGEVPTVAPIETTTDSARILWRTLLEPLATYALVVVVLMCLACAAFGTALNHVVIERAEQR